MYNDYMDNLFDRRLDRNEGMGMPMPQGQPQAQVQPVKMPHPLPQPSTEVGKIYMYEVRRGDNIYGIARQFNTSAEFIKCMNQLHDNARLHPGQRILVPVLYKRPQPRPTAQPMSQTNMQDRQSYDLYF